MTTPAQRRPGKRGLKPQRQGSDRFPLRYVHEYARGGALPAPVYPIDVTSGIEDFGMLGNGPDPTCTTHPDGVGDCTYAGRQHVKMLKAAAAGISETWETSNELVAEYLAYDHGKDEGAVIADLLLTWYKSGKILGFAPVDHTDPAQVDAAMQAFHGGYAGVCLTDADEDDFSNGEPWGTGSTTPNPDDGHCIVKCKADGKSRDGWVTWGAVQESTLKWTRNCLQEMWVIITSEDEAAKIDMAALVADIEALGGKQDVPPTPAPQPEPTPAPAPQPTVNAALASAAAAWLPEHHRGRGTVLATALEAWLTANGYDSPEPGGEGPSLEQTALSELSSLVRRIAASADGDVAEAIEWLRDRGL